MNIYLEYNGESEARKDKKSGGVKYQKETFYLCTGLRHWIRYGKWLFRYNEILWFLDGKYIDWTDENFSLKKITSQIKELSKGKEFEDILKDAQLKFDCKINDDFQKWLIENY